MLGFILKILKQIACWEKVIRKYYLGIRSSHRNCEETKMPKFAYSLDVFLPKIKLNIIQNYQLEFLHQKVHQQLLMRQTLCGVWSILHWEFDGLRKAKRSLRSGLSPFLSPQNYPLNFHFQGLTLQTISWVLCFILEP